MIEDGLPIPEETIFITPIEINMRPKLPAITAQERVRIG